MKLGDSDTLYIRISDSEVIFARYDHLRRQTVNYVVYKVKPDISLNANIHEAVGRVALTRGDFNYVRVLMEGPATLVPLSEFEEDLTEDLYFFNFSGNRRRLRVFYDTLPHLNAVLLFAADKDVCHTLEETFPNILFQSAETPQLLHFASCSRTALSCGRFFVSLSPRRMSFSAFRNGKIELYNSYALHHLRDAAYYVLQAMQLWHFRQETDELYLGGDRDMAEQLQPELQPYVHHLSLLKAEEEFNSNVAALQKDLPYDLVTLLLRAY